MKKDDKSVTNSVAGTENESVAVSRRSLLRGATLVVGGATVLAAGLTAEPAVAGAMAQKAAGYQVTPKDGKSCATCSLYQPPSACKLIAGPIVPTGWCRFYVKKA